MASLGTNRLNIVNDQPSVKKLWNDRYRLEFYCDNDGKKTDWYYTNVGNILPDFGTLQGDGFGENPSESISASKYADMRLIEVGTEYVSAANQHYVKLTYETLTAAWVLEKDEDTDYELNGLKRVTRQSVALPDTAYTNVIGTSTITSDGTTLYLGSYKIEETDAKWTLSEVWLESGELSRSDNFEDGKESVSITQIGGCASAPVGYTVVDEKKDNTQGFETCTRTFYKDDSVLSHSNDYVGSQLAEVIEVFNPSVQPTPTNNLAVLGSKSQSNVDGIPTTRYTFLVPSILSVRTPLVGGQQTVAVSAFNMTSAQVGAELSEVTTGHKLIDQNDSDYEGIKTSQFTFEVDDFETRSHTESGLLVLTKTQLGLANFLDGAIGTDTLADGAKTLYLGGEDIDNGGSIKKKVQTWLEAGVISVSTDQDSITSEVTVDAINLTVSEVRTKVSEITINHSIRSQLTRDYEGLNSIRYVFDIRSTTTETELGDPLIGVEFETGIQTDGSSDFIITRKYSISSANTASSIKKLLPPEITDPVFDGTGGTQKAYIVDQEVKPNGLDGAELTRTFAMVPSKLDEWDEMVVRFPGVERGPFQLDEGFDFRSEPFSEAVPVRMCREFFLSNPQRICRPDEFRPVDENGNRVSVLTANTVPTADEYIGYVNSGKYLNDRVSILRWQGDIWERRIVQFKAE